MTTSLDDGKFRSGETGKIVEFTESGSIKISLDSMDQVLTWRSSMRDNMKVISASELEDLRKTHSCDARSKRSNV